MTYLGGKCRLRKQIAELINKYRNGRTYIEPFVGGGWVLQEIQGGERFASDANAALITLYKSLQKGWIPPDNISEELYNKLKVDQDENNPLTAFAGFGCSFSGKYFGGYARDSDKYRSYSMNCKNSLLKQLPMIKSVNFSTKDYKLYDPVNSIIYCDPPYEGTTRYKFGVNHNEFWDIMKIWSRNNTVLISSYTAPDTFECIKEFDTHTSLRDSESKQIDRVERVFMLRERKIRAKRR